MNYGLQVMAFTRHHGTSVATKVQSKDGGYGSGTASATTSAAGFANTTVAGNLLICIGWGVGASSGVNSIILGAPTALNGQSWTLAGSVQTVTYSTGHASSAVGIWYIPNASATTSSFTITETATVTSGTSVEVEFALYEIGNILASPFDAATGNTGTSTTVDAGSLTLTVNDFVITAACNPTGHLSVGTNFTLGIASSGASVFGDSQYNLGHAAGSFDTAFATGSSINWAASAAAFKI